MDATTTTTTEVIREAIQQSRQRHGWSVADQAEHLGVHRTTIWRWENGEIDTFTLKLISLILSERTPVEVASVQIAS